MNSFICLYFRDKFIFLKSKIWRYWQIYQFYSTKEEFKKVCSNLKNHACPHCNSSGYLILHGFLYGYGDSELIRRGHRIFCSNRNLKSGCGRTFSMLKSKFIKNFMVSAVVLSRFLKNISDGLCPAKAFKTSGSLMHKTSAYRLLNKFKYKQSQIRTLLTRINDPPDLMNEDPLIQTIIHLIAVFKGCIVSQFQQYFQVSFL